MNAEAIIENWSDIECDESAESESEVSSDEVSDSEVSEECSENEDSSSDSSSEEDAEGWKEVLGLHTDEMIWQSLKCSILDKNMYI